MLARSQNFAILESHAPQLTELGTLAERYYHESPNTATIKLRQYGELMAQMTAAKMCVYIQDNDTQVARLRRLADDAKLPKAVLDLFHYLRKHGNAANHELKDDHGIALTSLKVAHRLANWYHATFGAEHSFQASVFIPPLSRKDLTDTLQNEIEELQQKLNATLSAAQKAELQVAQERELRATAEEEKEKLAALNEETNQYATSMAEQLLELQKEAEEQSSPERQELIEHATEAAKGIDLDEADTRRFIDEQLRNAGWEADTDKLTFKAGIRPQKGRNLAIAEWPTASGPADYVLFIGLTAVAVVEAKRQRKDVYSAVDQAKRYSRDYNPKESEVLVEGGPWIDADNHSHQIPFVFATNGRPYLKQLETKSGIWFCDLRLSSNQRRALEGWYSPRGLQELLIMDSKAADEKLKTESFDYGITLRDYQQTAIRSTEAAIEQGRREMLLAMATGTGKTATCISLVYRLLKTNRFKRILFLVDRSALGNQTHDAFNNIQMEQLQKFSAIYDVKGLDDKEIDDSTRVHIATVQSMVKRLMYSEDDTTVPTVDQYDAIVIDECHRGYLLDKELSEHELSFRDEADYISKYRRVLEHFDAIKIGLTATPALHTTEIFGEPIYTYSYREAVIDGWLIDHEPPVQIKTKLSESGIKWKDGESVEFLNTKTGEIDLFHLKDELGFEIQSFNKQVITEPFNKTVCEALVGLTGDIANPIDPMSDEKTLIFCATDSHADIVVKSMKDAFTAAGYSVDDDMVMKITGASDKPQQLIRRFRNETLPKVAVTVDLLTTGIDIPSICNLVFIRRVNSRILYDQMLGRATRRCDEIGKEFFKVFDAVGLYDTLQNITNMKPVSVNSSISFQQLVKEIINVDDEETQQGLKDQFIAKLHRTQRRYSQETNDSIDNAAGVSVSEIAPLLQQQSIAQTTEWFKTRPTLASVLDYTGDGPPPRVAISEHEDELLSTDTGYGEGEKPEDFLDGFIQFIKANENKIEALKIVTQRPRELTRQHLKDLKRLLEEHHFREADLRAAWRASTNEDIAASIIGYVRQASLGDPLIPYSERVAAATKEITLKGDWTPLQRKWLDRIALQLQNEKNVPVIDPETLNQGSFAAQGGFRRIDKVFDGRLENILEDINEAVWRNTA
ncbi:type I restriction-modification system endonuclease [Sneathiella sp. P13V-1]|uniref:type I restriction-modification system endonuclease n=1 Tax=Sneathiella sp. P13V-1 TaxID=2697366 RepID=UPI00187B1D37|nr:type I restriction-modification system endonuclease [Sneathiella sp. P13V-1]MBE7635240.1 type I restriction-modification system endonuclease [Sneathiella sp. P13V-1]